MRRAAILCNGFVLTCTRSNVSAHVLSIQVTRSQDGHWCSRPCSACFLLVLYIVGSDVSISCVVRQALRSHRRFSREGSWIACSIVGEHQHFIYLVRDVHLNLKTYGMRYKVQLRHSAIVTTSLEDRW